MKTKLFLFIFLLSAIITSCDNNVGPEEEKIPETPVDTTVVNPPDTTAVPSDTPFIQKIETLLRYLMSIPSSEMIKDYDYPPFIREEIAYYETASEYERNNGRMKIFVGELESGEKRFLKHSITSSCWICFFYNENGDNVSYDNNEKSDKSIIDVKNWKFIYDWGNGKSPFFN